MTWRQISEGYMWFGAALFAYALMLYCVFWALKPKQTEWQAYPDWFWGGDITEGQWVKPEQNDLEQSKPTSGAG